jgi:hypothetical protein
MNRGLPTTLFILVLVGLLFSFAPAKALTDHLIISQVQVATITNTNGEFVELYNPTNSNIDLTNLRLTRLNEAGTPSGNLVSSLSGVLSAGHYYLIAQPAYISIPVIPDRVYSASSSGITTNNTIVLYATDHATIIDKVGFGLAKNYETAPAPNPSPGQS